MPDELSPERRAALEREKAANQSRAGWYDFSKLSDDIVRLLPLLATEQVGYKWVYYYIDKCSYTCPEETFGEPSVLARAGRALQRLGTPEANAIYEALCGKQKGARRCKWLMKWITRKNPKVPLWAESPHAIYKVAFAAYDKDHRDIAHGQTGRDMRISKTGSGFGSKYEAAVLDQCNLAETKEERLALKARSNEMNAVGLIRSKINEEKAAEALRHLIPAALWSQIAEEVTGHAAVAQDDGDGDAPSTAAPDDEGAPAATVTDDEDAGTPPPPQRAAPAPAKAPAAAKAAPAKAPAPAQRAPAVVDDEEGPPPPQAQRAAPAPTKTAAPAKAAKPATIPDDDEGPVPPANRAAAAPPKAAARPATRPPVVVDDEEAPPQASTVVPDDEG